jgi:hypothetical protein
MHGQIKIKKFFKARDLAGLTLTSLDLAGQGIKEIDWGSCKNGFVFCKET